MKAIKSHLQATNPDRVAKFEKGAQEFAKKIVANFKDFEFYVGESMNPEGMVALLVSWSDVITVVALIMSSELPTGWYRACYHH